MREIKTEAQTLDLSKKITVEVSLAELIFMEAAMMRVDVDSAWRRIHNVRSNDVGTAMLRPEPTAPALAGDIERILAGHIPEEDE
ncbi:hypothetical protein [Bacillus stratosphericus]|uniref:hypothetical protein n=1 Tax=Bacillus stratosphericus TaxID=293386 RepID=UPI001CFAD3BD|nr:hypothetical protein [Bacillus stratosphericus]